MPLSQKDIFLSGEGDAYFRRNDRRDADFLAGDPIAGEILRLGRSFKRMLDIGCCAGERLNYLSSRLQADGFGIDPSGQAVAWARERFPGITVAQATAEAVPFPGTFDLVVFSHCLYLIDRELLMASVAEADKKLAAGGVLCVCDFTPVSEHRRKYKHYEGMFVYKCDYSRFFLANPQYTLLSSTSYPFQDGAFDSEPNSRLTTVLLYKNPVDTAYPLMEKE